jgi:hypothetical protein
MAEVGTRLIFENERVRVWEFTLQPGESIGTHHHDHDFFFYPADAECRRGLFPQRRRHPCGKECRRPSLSRGIGRTEKPGNAVMS